MPMRYPRPSTFHFGSNGVHLPCAATSKSGCVPSVHKLWRLWSTIHLWICECEGAKPWEGEKLACCIFLGCSLPSQQQSHHGCSLTLAPQSEIQKKDTSIKRWCRQIQLDSMFHDVQLGH